MAKFNKTTATIRNTTDTKNVAGFASFSRDDFKGEVASVILNSMLNGNSFYETEADRIKKIETFVTAHPEQAEFLAKAMVYTRTEGNLRSVAHLMGTMLSENVKGQEFLKPALFKTMLRPDDATEMIALWNSKHPGKMIPNSLRKAVKLSLENRWDAYQLKKYFGNGAVKVSNLVNLAHPTPKDDAQRLMFKQALEGTLPNIDTAQTVNAGSTGEDRAMNYGKMLAERKLGYMGALKNVRNIVESGANAEIIDMLCDLLANERAVRGSMLLPFRFVQAYKEVSAMRFDLFKQKKILRAIEQGFIYSAGNVSIIDDNETIALMHDESGSMRSNWRSQHKDGEYPFDIGLSLMASMMVGLDKNRAVGYLWADNARKVSIDGSPMEFVMRTNPRGGGTRLAEAVDDLIRTNTVVDKLVIFTDMQQNEVSRYDRRNFNDTINAYRKINPAVKVLFWNLEGYGAGTPMKLSNGVLEVAGFSDKMLKVIPKMWQDRNALVKEIEAIELV